MSDYTKIVDYAAKDALITGNPVKLVKGTELGAEYDAIATAIATKANSASPAFTGVSGFAVGAVGAPSIYMTGYATTGWYNIGANNWGFAVSGAKVLDISSTGLAVTGTTSTTTGMAVGGATAGTGGIAFPATAVAVADVNTLDDYEEGTFTPGISFGAGTTGITYNAQLGSYTKIGNRVICSMYVELTAKGSSTGQVRVTGLPFTIGNSSNNYGSAGLRINQISSTGIIQGYPELNTTSLLFEQVSTAGTMTTLTDANFGATSSLMISVQYHV